MLVSLAVIATFALVVLASMYLLQASVTFPRPPAFLQRPQALADAHGERLWIEVEGCRVEAWLLPGAIGSPAPLLVHAHGNGELIDFWADAFEPLRAAGIHVLLVEYPGYGRSTGTPSERTVIATLAAAYDRVARDPRVDSRRIIGYGRSLGGGAIAQLAAQRTLESLVLESSFTSLADIVRAYHVPDWLIVNRFDTRAVLKSFRGPVLLLHGEHDGVIPVAHAHALQRAMPGAALHVLQCGHNDCPPQWELVLSFLAANGVCKRPDQEASYENEIC